MLLRVSELIPSQFGKIAEIRNRQGSGTTPWSGEDARVVLCDGAREEGATTRLVWNDDRLLGCAALVTVGAGRNEYYISPYLAANREAARFLLREMIRQAAARGAMLLRTTVARGDSIYEPVLKAERFSPVFDFIELSLEVSEADVKSDQCPLGLQRIELTEIDPSGFAKLHNLCFADEENAPPIDWALAAEMLAHPGLWTESSGVWADDSGAYRAFVLCHGAGEIDAVGVEPGLRRKRIATSLLNTVLREALHRGVPALHAVVAETNVASIVLHRSMGFREDARRTNWERKHGGAV